VSSSGLCLATCLAQTTAEVEEAGRAGEYEVPFAPVPERIRWLTATGAVARARQALELAGQEAQGATAESYLAAYREGLSLLRQGRMDLGTVSVTSQGLVLPADYEHWAELGHRGIVLGSVSLVAGDYVLVEDRSEYDPGDPVEVKDYLVDHREGRIRRLSGGRAGAGETCTVSYRYFYKQPPGVQKSDYTGSGVQMGMLGRQDYQR